MNAREVGTAFLEALSARDYAAARSLVADEVRFRMLVPHGLMTESDGDATVGRFAGWFGDAKPFEVEGSTIGEVEGRAAVTYRFRLRRAGKWEAIEQHLMLDVNADGLIEAIDLLCSGFRSIAVCELDRVHRYDAGELGCADGLAREFRRHVQEIPIGEVLVVSTRDPAAKEDLPPLARMMGHMVRSVEQAGDGRLLVSVERGR